MDLLVAILNLLIAVVLMVLVIAWLVNDDNDDPNQTFHAQVDDLHKAVRRLRDKIIDELRGK